MNARNLRLFKHDHALAAWDGHAERLATVVKLVEAIATNAPCTCGLCRHCSRLTWLQVEIKTAVGEAVSECNELAVCGAVCESMFPQTAA